jgi:hypothetical protein
MSAIPIAAVRINADCQSRVNLDITTVEEYAYRMKEGATFPPIVVFHDGSNHWLSDGFHRFAAAKTLARERGDEATAEIEADIRQGTHLDAVRYSLSANANHGKRREPGDYANGYLIAVRVGLCEPYDVEAVRTLLACSERWARQLTAAARTEMDRKRDARIVESRERGEPIRQIAAREGLSPMGVHKVEQRSNVNFRHPSESVHPPSLSRPPPNNIAGLDRPPPRPLPASIAALDRPSLAAWSDVIYTAEQYIAAIKAAQGYGAPRKSVQHIRDLLQLVVDLTNTTTVEPEQ